MGNKNDTEHVSREDTGGEARQETGQTTEGGVDAYCSAPSHNRDAPSSGKSPHRSADSDSEKHGQTGGTSNTESDHFRSGSYGRSQQRLTVFLDKDDMMAIDALDSTPPGT